jgi:hypothetical protein
VNFGRFFERNAPKANIYRSNGDISPNLFTLLALKAAIGLIGISQTDFCDTLQQPTETKIKGTKKRQQSRVARWCIFKTKIPI